MVDRGVDPEETSKAAANVPRLFLSAPADNVRGAMLMLTAGAIFTLTSGVMKHLAQSIPEMEIAFMRHVIGTVCMLPMFLVPGRLSLRTTRWGGHLWRAAFGFLAFYLNLWALARLPMAETQALAFATPLWSLPVAALLLGQRPGWRLIVATLIGFGGVLLIAPPSLDMNPAIPVALSSALATSLAMLMVKRLSASEPPDRIAFYFLLFGTVYSVVPAWFVWVPPTPAEWAWLLALGSVAMIGQLCLTRAYTVGEFSRMAPLDFARLPLAVLLGWAAFGDLPDLSAFAGMAVIAAASLYVVSARR